MANITLSILINYSFFFFILEFRLWDTCYMHNIFHQNKFSTLKNIYLIIINTIRQLKIILLIVLVSVSIILF